MSSGNKQQVFRAKITDKMVATNVANALRAELTNSTAAVKQIGQKTKANLLSITNWYNGLNAPKTSHFLTLSRTYPAVLRSMLEMIGRSDVWMLCEENGIPEKIYAESEIIPPEKQIYSAKFCTINLVLDSQMAGQFNHRQLWFLSELRRGVQVNSESLVATWGIVLRTARNDIAGLEQTGMIIFVGARKNGYYAAV
jgi:hypothetical protein